MSGDPERSVIPWEAKLEMVLTIVPQTKGELRWFHRRELSRLAAPGRYPSKQGNQGDMLASETVQRPAEPNTPVPDIVHSDIDLLQQTKLSDAEMSTTATISGHEELLLDLAAKACRPQQSSTLSRMVDPDEEPPVPRPFLSKQTGSESNPTAPVNPFANVSLTASKDTPPLFGAGGYGSLGKALPVFGFDSSAFADRNVTPDSHEAIGAFSFRQQTQPVSEHFPSAKTLSIPAPQALSNSPASKQMTVSASINGPSNDAISPLKESNNQKEVIDEAALRSVDAVNHCSLSGSSILKPSCTAELEVMSQVVQSTAGNGTLEKMSDDELLQTADGNMNDEERERLRKRLVTFYERHNKSKIDSVSKTLEKFLGKENVMLKKLREKYLIVKDSLLPPGGNGPTCFLDFEVAGRLVGTVEVMLYADKAPLAAENFRSLCTGEKGIGVNTFGKHLCYRNCSIHRIVPNFCIQGGDFTKNDGTGGVSIYPPNSSHGDMWGKFKDEQLMGHARKGLLSMANNGPNRNGSQFFITLRATPHLDGKHVVFGEVINGIDVIDQVAQMATDKNQRPFNEVRIADCGEIKLDGMVLRASETAEKQMPISLLNFGAGEGVITSHRASGLLTTNLSSNFSVIQSGVRISSKELKNTEAGCGMISSVQVLKEPPLRPKVNLKSSMGETETRIRGDTLLSGVLLDADIALKDKVNEFDSSSVLAKEVVELTTHAGMSIWSEFNPNTDDAQHDALSTHSIKVVPRVVKQPDNSAPAKNPFANINLVPKSSDQPPLVIGSSDFGALGRVGSEVRSRGRKQVKTESIERPKCGVPKRDQIAEFASGQPYGEESKAIKPECSSGEAMVEDIHILPREANSVGLSHRERLVSIYKIHNPSKLNQVDKILRSFKGKENQLFAKVANKYKIGLSAQPISVQSDENASTRHGWDNENPKITLESSSRLASSPKSIAMSLPDEEKTDAFGHGCDRDRLIRFYKKRNPSKCEQVDLILDAYDGQCDLLFRRLIDKYNLTEKQLIVATSDVEPPNANTQSLFDKDIIQQEGPIVESNVALAKLRDTCLAQGLSAEGKPPSGGNGVRERIVAIYKMHNPSKLKDVDKLLRQFKGKEGNLLEKIANKYGSSKMDQQNENSPRGMKTSVSFMRAGALPTSIVVPISNATSSDTFVCGNDRDRLIRFYAIHNPSKLVDIDKILEAYDGQTELMYRRLSEKYNVAIDHTDMSASVISVLGDTDFDFVSVAEPTPDACNVRIRKARLEAFYEKHNPVKLSHIDQILKAYGGDEGELEKLISMNSPLKQSKLASNEASEKRRVEMHRKLTAFYERNNPSKVGAVDNLLESYKGREHLLFRKLLLKTDSIFPRVIHGLPTSPTPKIEFESKQTPRESHHHDHHAELTIMHENPATQKNTVSPAPTVYSFSAAKPLASKPFAIVHDKEETMTIVETVTSIERKPTMTVDHGTQSIFTSSERTDLVKVQSAQVDIESKNECESTYASSEIFHPDLDLVMMKANVTTSPFRNENTVSSGPIVSSFLSTVKPSASNPFAIELNKKETTKIVEAVASNEVTPQVSTDRGTPSPVTPCGKTDFVKLQSVQQEIESFVAKKGLNLLSTCGKSSKPLPPRSIYPSSASVMPVDASPVNPFVAKAPKESYLALKKTEFLDSVPISSGNPFLKTKLVPGTKATPFSRFGSVSSSGSHFLDTLKASEGNPFANPSACSSTVAMKESTFLREMKPSLNNPFAPGSPGVLSSTHAFSIGFSGSYQIPNLAKNADAIEVFENDIDSCDRTQKRSSLRAALASNTTTANPKDSPKEMSKEANTCASCCFGSFASTDV